MTGYDQPQSGEPQMTDYDQPQNDQPQTTAPKLQLLRCALDGS